MECNVDPGLLNVGYSHGVPGLGFRPLLEGAAIPKFRIKGLNKSGVNILSHSNSASASLHSSNPSPGSIASC